MIQPVTVCTAGGAGRSASWAASRRRSGGPHVSVQGVVAAGVALFGDLGLSPPSPPRASSSRPTRRATGWGLLARRAGLGARVATGLTVRTASTTWTCSAKARRARACPGCTHRRPWARSCGRSRGHVRQLGAVAAGVLTALASLAGLLSGATAHPDAVTWLDVDDTMREAHGCAKQGVDYGYNKRKG